jgi:hypothetical protein
VSRLNAKVRCNYYPLPLREAERIRNLLRFPIEPFSTLDPCVGDSAAFATITADSNARRYGIELDAYRAEQAGPSLTNWTPSGWSSHRFPWPLSDVVSRNSGGPYTPVVLRRRQPK